MSQIVAEDSVFISLDKDTIYKVPEDLHSQGLDDAVVSKLGLKCKKADLSDWKKVVSRLEKDGYLNFQKTLKNY